jgi:AcrR family transcriptional regulator
VSRPLGPNDSRGARRREQIIDAALAATRDSAVADVQLAAIAGYAGMRPSHLLYYFGSRDEILVGAAQRVERTLAEGRAERLEAIPDADDRLRAYVAMYLPDDRHDPAWKLWVEGWLHPSAGQAFAAVGDAAHAGWHADLIATVEYAVAHLPGIEEGTSAFCRRMIFLLDGLAIHVASGHLSREDALNLAMTTLRTELRLPAPSASRALDRRAVGDG